MLARACRVTAWCLAIAMALPACGGSKSPEPTSPTGPAPVTPPAPAPAPPPVPPPPSGFGNSYFDRISSRSEVVASYSLRDQGMLDTYARGTGGAGSIDVTYNFSGDPDPRKQDAAKVLIPANKVSVPTHVRLPIPSVEGESLFVTWDAWWGREFDYSNTSIGNYKAFQFASPSDRIWTEIKSDFDLAKKSPNAVAMVAARSYGVFNETVGPNVTDKNPLSPQAAEFPIAAETWTRYWALFNPSGGWFEFSLWVADETRGPVLVLDRLQLKPDITRGADGWQSFWLEYDTSATQIPPTRGTLTAYIRNVVMLKGIRNPAALFELPVR